MPPSEARQSGSKKCTKSGKPEKLQIEQDFEGEFSPIKSLTKEEIAKDRTLQTLKLMRKFNKPIGSETHNSNLAESSDISADDETFHTPPSSPLKKSNPIIITSSPVKNVSAKRKSHMYNFSKISLKNSGLAIKVENPEKTDGQDKNEKTEADTRKVGRPPKPTISKLGTIKLINSRKDVDTDLRRSSRHQIVKEGSPLEEQDQLLEKEAAADIENSEQPEIGKSVPRAVFKNSHQSENEGKDNSPDVEGSPTNTARKVNKNLLTKHSKTETKSPNREKDGPPSGKKDPQYSNVDSDNSVETIKLSEFLKIVESDDNIEDSTIEEGTGASSQRQIIENENQGEDGSESENDESGTAVKEIIEIDITTVSKRRDGQSKNTSFSGIRLLNTDRDSQRIRDEPLVESDAEDHLEFLEVEDEGNNENEVQDETKDTASDGVEIIEVVDEVVDVKIDLPSTRKRQRTYKTKKEKNQNPSKRRQYDISHIKLSNSNDHSDKLAMHDSELIKKIITSQLNSRQFKNIHKTSLEAKYKEIYKLFEHTVKDSEGHSALLIGSRSSGKTSVVEAALAELSNNYQDQYIAIKLNGVHQTDDKTALREIARGLDSSLRGLIGEDYSSFESRSINETFGNILSILDKSSIDGGKKYISVIFIIDEFEKFTTNRQTLLYNLFDLTQTSSIPICVLGITTKVTARESLEKRVRSRFSQRIISISKPLTILDFWNDCKWGLMIPETDLKNLKDVQYGKKWNSKVEAIYNDNESMLKKILFQNFHTIKNIKEFNNNCIYAISQINEDEPYPIDSNFAKYLNLQSINDLQSSINSLSELELLLVIASARCVAKFDLELVNFNLAYEEYLNLIKVLNSGNFSFSGTTSSSAVSNIRINFKTWSSSAMKNNWDNLIGKVLIIDPTSNYLTNQKRNMFIVKDVDENKMVQLEVNLDELNYLISDLSTFKKLLKL